MSDLKSMNWVAFIGNPNSGKSSLFNALTGMRQQVGNFPGVTVDKKTGFFIGENGEKVPLLDFPGLYSVYPNSADERIVVESIANPNHDFHPSKIVYVLDPMQIERHLLLATQLIDLGFPLILAVNMIDLAEKNKLEIDQELLQKKLGVPVILVSARSRYNLDKLKQAIQEKTELSSKPFRKLPTEALSISNKLLEKPEFQTFLDQKDQDIRQAKVLLFAQHANWIKSATKDQQLIAAEILEKEQLNVLDHQVKETMSRFSIITPLISKVVNLSSEDRVDYTDKIDRIITHKVFGPLIFFSIMFLVFQALFSWASYPMDLIDSTFSWLGNSLKYLLGNSWLTSLLTDGILAGIGGILIFVPQIFLLFLMVGILEEIGYMSRAVYMFDNVLQRFGLNGRSIVSLISGGACAIPAIMSTRTISNWKERLNTIMVTPLISCSARIPVYIVLVGFVVPDENLWGIFNYQGLAFMALYLISIIAALASAYVFKVLLKSDGPSYLMIELPQYKPPIWKNVFLGLREKLWSFVWDAGKVIFVISIVLWFLASYGPTADMAFAQKEGERIALANNLDADARNDVIAARKIEASYAGHMGKFIEPVIRPLGFDWKMGIALITSFAAREVFVSTMATIYAIGSSDDESTIRERLANEVNLDTGEKVYTPAVAMSLLLFYLFAMQCMSTLAVTKRETNSWKWPTIQFVYMTALAYLASFIAYQLMS